MLFPIVARELGSNGLISIMLAINFPLSHIFQKSSLRNPTQFRKNVQAECSAHVSLSYHRFWIVLIRKTAVILFYPSIVDGGCRVAKARSAVASTRETALTVEK
jgi:hypothetical protein